MMDHLQHLQISLEDNEAAMKTSADNTNDSAEETLLEIDLSVGGIMGWFTGQKQAYVWRKAYDQCPFWSREPSKVAT